MNGKNVPASMSNAAVNSVSLVPHKNEKTVAEFEVLTVFSRTNIFIVVRVQMKCEDMKSADNMPY